jgi:holliday junction DNA helicase RuvA
MIGFLSGKVINLFNQKIILKIPSGVGYIVQTNPNRTYFINENLDLYILHVQREDKVELFGFEQLKDRECVDNLMKVSGVGPKVATSIVHSLGHDKINEAIANNDPDALGVVKGLGKKTAQKIILELKGVLVDVEQMVSGFKTNDFSINFTDALSNLGYKRGEIVNSITKLKKEGEWDESNLVGTIKKGLEILGKR